MFVYDNFNADLKKQGLDSIEIKDFKVDGNEYYNGPEPSQWPNSEDTRKKYGFYEDETYKEDDEHIKLAHEGEHFENNELGSEEIPERKIDVIGEILNDTSYEYVYNELKAEDETGEACSNFEREVSNFIEEFREQCKNKLWEDKTYHYEWEVADGEVNKKYWNEGGRRDMEINRRI